MEPKSNYFFLILSSDKKFIDDKVEYAKNIFAESIILNFDGRTFDASTLNKLTDIYNQKNTENKEIIFLVNDFGHVSKIIQSKLLVTMENLKGGKSFILVSSDKGSIIETLRSRSVIFEDNNSSFLYSNQNQTINEIIEMINKKEIVRFWNYLEKIDKIDSIISLSSDIANLSYEKKIQGPSLDELLKIIASAKVVNSVNIVKTKLMEVIF